MALRLVGGDLADRALGVLAEVEHHRGDVGDEHEGLGPQCVGQPLCGRVLVDDGVDALQRPALVDDRDPAAARGDDDQALVDEAADGVELDDLDRLGRGDQAAVAASGVLADDPALLGDEPGGLLDRVERSDRFGGQPERRIILADDDVGDDGDDARQVDPAGLANGEREQGAELALRHRAEDVQGHLGDLVGPGALLDGEVPDLRTVAVHEHDVPARLAQTADRGRHGPRVLHLF